MEWSSVGVEGGTIKLKVGAKIRCDHRLEGSGPLCHTNRE